MTKGESIVMKINFFSLGIALSICFSAHTELRVAVDGPTQVCAGQDFEYTIRVVSPPDEKNSMVLMYYVPPQQLECVETESRAPALFKVAYAPDLRRVYGQGTHLTEDEPVTVSLTMKACDTSPVKSLHHLILSF